MVNAAALAGLSKLFLFTNDTGTGKTRSKKFTSGYPYHAFNLD